MVTEQQSKYPHPDTEGLTKEEVERAVMERKKNVVALLDNFTDKGQAGERYRVHYEQLKNALDKRERNLRSTLESLEASDFSVASSEGAHTGQAGVKHRSFGRFAVRALCLRRRRGRSA